MTLTILCSWVLLSIIVGVAADSRGRQAFIQTVIGSSYRRPRNSKGGASLSRFAAAALTADRIDYWVRRYAIQYWHGTLS
jgi:hypothetical protein